MESRRHPLCWSTLLGLALALTIQGGAAAQSELQTTPTQTTAQREAREAAASRTDDAPRDVATADSEVRYQPPRRGAPRAKLGGGLRFAALGSHVTLHALAPDHVAHTRSKSPVLYWFVDPLPDPRSPIVFTIIDESSIEPVAETRVARPEQPGIQAVDLAALGVLLEPEIEYEWSVAVVVDRLDRSRDRVSRGYLRYVGEDPEFGSLPGDATSSELARAGLWYDALDRVSTEIDTDPEAAEPRAARAALLDQAGFELSRR